MSAVRDRAVPAMVRRGLLAVVRRGRTVAWTPDWMGFGNVLLLAMWASEGTPAGRRRYLRETAALTPWLSVLPGLRSLVLSRDEVRFTDRRVMPWSESNRASGADGAVPLHEPIDTGAVERFLAATVLPGNRLGDHRAPVEEDALVVNVRRGDYYSDSENRRQYGFDVAGYLRVAVDGSIAADGLPSRILVVSDDVVWCRRELAWLADLVRVDHLDESGPVSDFATVAAARRMVITNSTFSYWAAHVSNVTHGDNHAQVWAPRFFDRTQNGGRSWLVDERWSIVEDLPGGWDIEDGDRP